MTRSSVALIALTTMLAGCSLAPKYVQPARAVPATLPEGGVYPRAASDAPDVTQVGWRAFFLDPRLRAVIETGLANNRDLRVAAANVLQARAQYRVQRADLVPTTSASGSAIFTNNATGAGGVSSGASGTGGVGTGTGTSAAITGGSSNLEIYSVDVGFSALELDLFGRVRNLSLAALEQYLASTEGERATRISLIAELATAWVTLATDQEQLKLSEQTLGTFAETLKLTTAQFRIGVASELEAKQAETNYQAARSDIATLRTRIAQDQNALNLLDALPPSLASDVLLRRPDVLQAEHRLIAENANIGAARAAFFPKISLTATLGTISTALSGLFGGGSFTYSAGPGIALPLFDGGRNAGNLAYAKASRQAAVGTYERAVQTAFREVADALAQRGTIGEQIAAQTARADAAGVAARLSDARYRAGVDSFLVALDAQRTAYAARQQLVTTRQTRAANLVQLYRALGGGLN